MKFFHTQATSIWPTESVDPPGFRTSFNLLRRSEENTRNTKMVWEIQLDSKRIWYSQVLNCETFYCPENFLIITMTQMIWKPFPFFYKALSSSYNKKTVHKLYWYILLLSLSNFIRHGCSIIKSPHVSAFIEKQLCCTLCFICSKGVGSIIFSDEFPIYFYSSCCLAP